MKLFKLLSPLQLNLKKPNSIELSDDIMKFHSMLIKMKKKRPNFNINRIMKNVYGSDWIELEN